jgi:hypothetical protein
MTRKAKTKSKQSVKEYNKSEAGKEAQKRYRQSKAGKEAQNRYKRNRWARDPEFREKHYAYQREYRKRFEVDKPQTKEEKELAHQMAIDNVFNEFIEKLRSKKNT